eukprot:scaffold221660_cov31-Tisochrysis_lutea.AAC.2
MAPSGRSRSSARLARACIGLFTFFTSSPAQKARPSPWRTTARTERSAASERAHEAIARNMCMSSELSLSGRHSRTVTTPFGPLLCCTRAPLERARRPTGGRIAGRRERILAWEERRGRRDTGP